MSPCCMQFSYPVGKVSSWRLNRFVGIRLGEFFRSAISTGLNLRYKYAVVFFKENPLQKQAL